MFIKNWCYIQYTWKHKKAFLKIEKELKGYNTFRGYTHDLLKLVLYFILPKNIVSKLHTKYSRHHDRAKTMEDYAQKVFDYESARYTKPDKPLSAREFIYTKKKNEIGIFEPLLQKYGL